MLIGFNFEKIIGSLYLFGFWIITVLGGNIFGALVTSNYALGSDMYVFALFAGLIGVTFVLLCRKDTNPQGSDRQQFCGKICLVISLVLLLVLAIILMASVAT